jgi:hypothetical protein
MSAEIQREITALGDGRLLATSQERQVKQNRSAARLLTDVDMKAQY